MSTTMTQVRCPQFYTGERPLQSPSPGLPPGVAWANRCDNGFRCTKCGVVHPYIGSAPAEHRSDKKSKKELRAEAKQKRKN